MGPLLGVSSTYKLEETTSCKDYKGVCFINRELKLSFVLVDCLTDYYNRLLKGYKQLNLTLNKFLDLENSKQKLYVLGLDQPLNIDKLLPPPAQLTGNPLYDKFLECRNLSLQQGYEVASVAQEIINEWTINGTWTENMNGKLRLWTEILEKYTNQFTEVAIPICFTELAVVLDVTDSIIGLLKPIQQQRYALPELRQKLMEHCMHFLDKNYWKKILFQNKEIFYRWFKDQGNVSKLEFDLDLFGKSSNEKAYCILRAIQERGEDMNRIKPNLYNFDYDIIEQSPLLMQSNLDYNGMADFLYLDACIRALKEKLIHIYSACMLGQEFDLDICAEVLKRMRAKNLFQLQKHPHQLLLLCDYIQRSETQYASKIKRKPAKDLLNEIDYNIEQSTIDKYTDPYHEQVNRFLRNNPPDIGDIAGPMIFVFLKLYFEISWIIHSSRNIEKPPAIDLVTSLLEKLSQIQTAMGQTKEIENKKDKGKPVIRWLPIGKIAHHFLPGKFGTSNKKH